MLEDKLRELNAMLKPFADHIRAEERMRCATIARCYKTWDGEQPTRKNVELWAALLEHGQGISSEIMGDAPPPPVEPRSKP